MVLSVLAALIAIAAVGVACGSVALALRQSQRLTVEQTDGVDGGTVAKTDWAITPALMRMW
jgi:hypothetical protein